MQPGLYRNSLEGGGTGPAARCSWRDVVAVALVLLLATAPVLVKDGARPFLLVVTYIASLTLVKLLMKATMRSGLSFPNTMTTIHMLATTLVASAASRPKLGEARAILPISLANSAALALGNEALAFGGVAFVSMLSCCTPASTCAVEVLSQRRKLTGPAAAAVFLVCMGGMFCVEGELEFSSVSFVLVCLASLCRSFKCIWQHDLLKVSLPPCQIVAWGGIWSLVLMLPVTARLEGLDGFRHLMWAGRGPQALAAASTVAAVVLNMVQCAALQHLGPLLQHVIGNMQLLMVIVLASAWLREGVTLMQWAGVLFVALGAVIMKGASSPSQPAKEESPQGGMAAGPSPAPSAGGFPRPSRAWRPRHLALTSGSASAPWAERCAP